MEIGVAGPILAQKKHQNPHGTKTPMLYKMGVNIVVIIDIYGARAISHYFMITKTLNLTNEGWKLD